MQVVIRHIFLQLLSHHTLKNFRQEGEVTDRTIVFKMLQSKFSFFSKGFITADFIEDGTIPSISDMFTIHVIMCNSESSNFLINQVGIGSRIPEALGDFIIMSLMSVSETVLNSFHHKADVKD